jgi:acetyl esterase/lipase
VGTGARGHGAEFGADPSTIFVAGSSAGAHLMTLAALTSDDPTYQPGFERSATQVGRQPSTRRKSTLT